MAGRAREQVKTALGALRSRRAATSGKTILTYHRVGGGSSDEIDLPTDVFEEQLDILEDHRVISLDDALDEIDAGDDRPGVVLTFDDGFEDMHRNAWPSLRRRQLPFTLYLATAYLDARPMRWTGAGNDGSGVGMTWSDVDEMLQSGLLTVGNHTHDHVPITELDVEQLDRCTEEIVARVGVEPRHFAYPWGNASRHGDELTASRFRSAATIDVGRLHAGEDRTRVARLPVRQTDPLNFFEAKLTGRLVPEATYTAIVRAVQRATGRQHSAFGIQT